MIIYSISKDSKRPKDESTSISGWPYKDIEYRSSRSWFNSFGRSDSVEIWVHQ